MFVTVPVRKIFYFHQCSLVIWTFFASNLGAVSDKQGERFHQEILFMKSRCKNTLNMSVMWDYCWVLQRDTTEDHKQNAKSVKHFK